MNPFLTKVKNQLKVGGETLVRQSRNTIENNAKNHPLEHGRKANAAMLTQFEAAMVKLEISK